MDTQLTKSLTDLIDETLQELDELRKSRFAASEIKIEGPGDGIDGKPSNGELEAKKADAHEDEEKEDSDDESKDHDEVDKADDPEDDEADRESTKRKLASALGKKEDKDKEEEDEKEPHKEDPKHEAKEKKIAKELLDMHKSLEESSSLMKSYVDDRVQPLEAKLATILDLVNKIADQPAAPRGFTSKTTPLLKSSFEGQTETLSKSEVANKLFELKKSGTRVDSLDIAKAEMGQDLSTIVKKYEIS